MDRPQNTSGAQDAHKNPRKPPTQFWRWLILHVERKVHKRRAGRKKKKIEEPPADRAARKTATATVVIAILTLVMAGFSGLTYWEIRTGGRDTKAIADAAKKQACAAQQFANTAKLIDGSIDNAVLKLDEQAKATQNAASDAQQGMSSQLSVFKSYLRAVISITPVYDLVKNQIIFTVVNVGHSAALKVSISYGMETVHAPHAQPTMEQLENYSRPLPLDEDGPVYVEGDKQEFDYPLPPKSDMLRQYLTGISYVVYMKTSYADIFGDTEKAWGCVNLHKGGRDAIYFLSCPAIMQPQTRQSTKDH